MKKLLISSIVTASLFGFEFQPMGFKSIGMGGAGVANASGSFASYYNPALLAKSNYSAEFALSAGVGVREINLIDPIDKLANTYHLSDTIDTIADHAPMSGSNDKTTRKNIEGSLDEIYKLSQGNGFNVEPTVAFGVQMGNFSIGLYAMGKLVQML